MSGVLKGLRALCGQGGALQPRTLEPLEGTNLDWRGRDIERTDGSDRGGSCGWPGRVGVMCCLAQVPGEQERSRRNPLLQAKLKMAGQACVSHNCPKARSPQNWLALLGSHCSNRTMDGSLLAPLMNSSRDSLPSLFVSICLKILSVRFSGVDSSSGIFITEDTIL